MTTHNVRLRKSGMPVEDRFRDIDQLALAKLSITTSEVKQLDATMLGKIVMPGMLDYPADRMGKGMSPWDAASPLLIFMCETSDDVWLALKSTEKYCWGFTARSGGHSTAGYSSNAETVIDLTGLNHCDMISESQVQVGPGVNFGQLNKYLMGKKRHIPTGNCDDVCVGGYVLGGGYGYTSRQFGMQCDTLIAATMIMADGRTVCATKDKNPDLFWALRGGTGNQFGIVVNYIYETVPLEKIWGFVYTWGADQAGEAMFAAQEQFGKDTGLKIGYTGNLTTIDDGKGGREAVYMFSGCCVEGEVVGRAALEPLLSIEPNEEVLSLNDYYYVVNDKVEGKLPGPPKVDGMSEIKSSAYFAKPLTLQDWQEFVALFAQAAKDINPYNLIVLEAYGGAVNKVGPMDTAFVHRETYMDVYVDAFWSASDDDRLKDFDMNQEWMNRINQFLDRHSNGHYYQNYPQRNMPNFRWKYWGDAFPSLLFVKHKFDPDNRFVYEQSISPYPENDTRIKKSGAKSIWSDPHIEVELQERPPPPT